MFTIEEIDTLLTSEDCSLLEKELFNRFEVVGLKCLKGSHYNHIYLSAEIKYKDIFLAIGISFDKYFFFGFDPLPDNRFKRLQRVFDIFKEEIGRFENYSIDCFDMDDDLLLTYFDTDYLIHSLAYLYNDFNNEELSLATHRFIENTLSRYYFSNYFDFHNYVINYFPKIAPFTLPKR